MLVVAGSREVPGAARLAAEAALRAGAGKLQVATHAAVAPMLGLLVPEAMVVALPEPGGDLGRLLEQASRCDGLLIGPGLDEGEATVALTRALAGAAEEAGVVLDAAALAAAPNLTGRRSPPVLTPHAGEMASLLDRPREAIEADPEQTAREAAERFGCVVALKGVVTHIAAPDGQALVHRDGHIGLGCSGSGDVLAGIVTGLLARGAEPVQAICWGVYLHGQAGARLGERVGALGYLARELPAEVPGVLATLCGTPPA